MISIRSRSDVTTEGFDGTDPSGLESAHDLVEVGTVFRGAIRQLLFAADGLLLAVFGEEPPRPTFSQEIQMFNKLMSLLAVTTLSLTLACDKGGDAAKEGGGAEEKQAEGTKSAEEGGDEAAEKGGEEAAEKAADEPIICCDFGAAVGTSTASKCAEHDGKVLEDLEPPCTK